MAHGEAVEKGADEALLINTNGEVAEAASGNIFWVYQDKICTVPTGRGVLPGITRAIVLRFCQTLGLPTNKRVIKPEALRSSAGIFITQSRHRLGGDRSGCVIAAVGGSDCRCLQRNAHERISLIS